MKKNLILRFSFCLCLLSAGLISFSQDVIILKNGDEIQSKVIEISTDLIKYKKWNNQDGPIYATNKVDVFMIKYPNGTKDMFNSNQSQTNSIPNNNTSTVIVIVPPIDTLKSDSVDNYKDGKQNENRKMAYENGKVYDGEWKDDKKNGKGKMTYKDGSFYEGEWKDDKMEGDGIIVSASDGSKYVGHFVNDQKHGKGIVYNKNGNIVAEYNYVNGAQEGHFMINRKNGDDKFEGEMRNGEIEGPAIYYNKNPEDGVITTFTGEYKKSEMYNGVLIFIYPDGAKNSIEYKNGKKGKVIKEKAPVGSQNVSTDTPRSTQNTKPLGCEDVDFIGAFKISGGGAINDIYVATIRNKATYTKTVHIEWLDAYGQTQKAAFDVKAGEKIDGQLGLSAPGVRQPLNVHMTSCD